MDYGFNANPTARDLGEGVAFERIRRITGYLVGTLDRFNTGKRAEEHDRVKHGTSDLAASLVMTDAENATCKVAM